MFTFPKFKIVPSDIGGKGQGRLGKFPKVTHVRLGELRPAPVDIVQLKTKKKLSTRLSVISEPIGEGVVTT